MFKHTLRTASLFFSLLCFLLIGGATLALAQEIDTFTLANKLHEQGNVVEAIDLYESLAAQGVADPALYYNLGNAYYEQDEIGRSILNYQRALRLDPNDKDGRYNLHIARQQVHSISQGQTNLLDKLPFRFTRNQLAVIAVSLWIAWSILYLLHRLTRVRVRPILRATLLLTLIISPIFLLSAYRDHYRPGAVVVETAELRTDASPDARVRFTLPSGTELVVHEQRDTWLNVSIANNDISGWLSEDAAERLE